MPHLVASSKRHEGIAILDLSTAAHFGIGTAAGLSGVDPKIALLIALLAEGAYEVVKQRDTEAIFERGTGQSKINEIVDLLAMVGGAYLGHGLRDKIKEEPAVAAATPVPPAPSAVAGLGLGAYSTVRTRYSVWEWTQYNGWKFMLGSNSWDSAQQVKRALKTYQPNNWYDVYGSWTVSTESPVNGVAGTQHYTWGWAPTDVAWIVVYALYKILAANVVVTTSAASMDLMADFQRYELAQRVRTARTYGTAVA
jgi:hypothetical protein